jgi:predicted transport protein/polyhydroxyalkanoate synthesis regulator phasin
VQVEKSHFSENNHYALNPITGEEDIVPIWETTLFPPTTVRSFPLWFEDIPDPTLKGIMQEIYQCLQFETNFLATFGSRTLLDRIILLTVGESNSFAGGMKKMVEDGKMSAHEREFLEPVVQAGHAAAHRGWAATNEQVSIILDTIEGLMHRLLVLPKFSEELDDAVPRRNKSPQSPSKPFVPMKVRIENAPKKVREIYETLKSELQSLGSDIKVNPQKHYIAFRRNRNFASVQAYNTKGIVRVYLNLDPDSFDLSHSSLRDVRSVGHFGTGDLELTIEKKSDVSSWKDLFSESYSNS